MNLYNIKIDYQKCSLCGLCSRDCISGTIVMENDRPAAANPVWCSLCSHCVAICPEGAISHDGLTGMPSEPIGSVKLDPDMYRKIVMTRRSIRRFKDKPVPRQEIEEILKLAAYSPTASNAMDLGYTVITDRILIRDTGMSVYRSGERIIKFLRKQPIRSLITFLNSGTERPLNRYLDRYDLYKSWIESGRDIINHDAPSLILIHGPRTRFSRENAAIAADNITNYAHAKGLGTCYIGFLSVAMDYKRKLASSLGVPKGRKVYIALIMGYPAYRHLNTPVRPEPRINWIGQ